MYTYIFYIVNLIIYFLYYYKFNMNNKYRFKSEIKGFDNHKLFSLIGKDGNDLHKICKSINDGIFIRIYSSKLGITNKVDLKKCDRIHIEGDTENGVKYAKKLLEKKLFNDIFKTIVKCKTKNKKYIGQIIGVNGKGLKDIIKTVHDNCYIVYKKSEGFVITTNSHDSLKLAKKKILNRMQQYNLHNHIKKLSTKIITTPKHSSQPCNPFSLLSDSDSDDNYSDDDSYYNYASNTKKEYNELIKNKNHLLSNQIIKQQNKAYSSDSDSISILNINGKKSNQIIKSIKFTIRDKSSYSTSFNSSSYWGDDDFEGRTIL